MKRHAMIKVLLLMLFWMNCYSAKLPIDFDRNLRIVGGATARVGQFPHAAALILYLPNARSSFCGGSIISAHFILTVSVKFLQNKIITI